MKKTTFKRLVISAAFAAALSGNAFSAVVAKLGHAMPESHPQAQAMNKFAELAQKYTNNNVSIKIFSGSTLGSDEKMLQSVQAGTQEFYTGTLAPLSMRVKEVQVWDLPFMFANNQEVAALLTGASNQKIFSQLEGAGLVGLTWTGIGFRNLSNSKRPVMKLEDISGLKLRVMTNPVALETWKTLGANATPMAFAEVFTALEIKAIDGQENPLVHMYANKMQEVQKYISLTNHVYTPIAIVASKKFIDKLSPADRDGLKKAAHEAGQLQLQLLEAADKEVINKFRAEGVQVDSIAPAELVRIQDRVKPIIGKFTPAIGEDFVKSFQAEIDAVRQSAK